jgi:peptide/nickel transport system substrate-binding protein
MVDTITKFIASRDPAERVTLMKHFQNVYTANLDGIGLTAYPGALIINKRFANIPPGAPIMMYNWAEDNIIRERVFVPKDKQINAELFPNTLPGKPGDAGPISAN